MGTTDKIGTVDPVISLSRCDGMYLGSSAGQFTETFTTYDLSTQESPITLIKQASQKKIHSHQATLAAVVDFLSGEAPIDPLFVMNGKNEYYFSVREKQLKTETFEKWCSKERQYEIANEFFIDLERITQTVRKNFEVGSVIAIGMKWLKGGYDYMVKKMNVKFGEEWRKKFSDGDIVNLDMTIHYIWLQLMYVLGGIYFKRSHDPVSTFRQMMRAISFLASSVSARLVHFFGRLWALITGKMPSGIWMTSHGNSFIVALWFYLFCVMEILRAPQMMKEAMEIALIKKIVHVLVYGDDQVQVTDRDEVSKYINITLFEQWMKLYLNVTMRDVRDDVPLLVDPSGGYHKGQGIVYLKQLGVRNRNDTPGQSYYLPYRDASEYIIKAVWGREAKDRDVYDFMLSLLGHGYGTYASNHTAYTWLKNAFIAAVQLSPAGTWEESLGTVQDRAHTNTDFTKKARQAGIAMEDIKYGFPTWSTLMKKNIYDEAYHAHERGDPGLDNEDFNV